MITLSVAAFIALIVVTLAVGAAVSVRIYVANQSVDAKIARFHHDVAINDEAENGEVR